MKQNPIGMWPVVKLQLLDTLRVCGFQPPLLTTPEELLEIMP